MKTRLFSKMSIQLVTHRYNIFHTFWSYILAFAQSFPTNNGINYLVNPMLLLLFFKLEISYCLGLLLGFSLL